MKQTEREKTSNQEFFQFSTGGAFKQRFKNESDKYLIAADTVSYDEVIKEMIEEQFLNPYIK